MQRCSSALDYIVRINTCTTYASVAEPDMSGALKPRPTPVMKRERRKRSQLLQRVDWMTVAGLFTAMTVMVLYGVRAGRVNQAYRTVSKCADDMQACTDAQVWFCSSEIAALHNNKDTYNAPLFVGDLKACFLEHQLVPDVNVSMGMVLLSVIISFVCGSALFIVGYTLTVYVAVAYKWRSPPSALGSDIESGGDDAAL